MKKVIMYHARRHIPLVGFLLLLSAVSLVAACAIAIIKPATSHGRAPQVSLFGYQVRYPVANGTGVDSLVRSYADDRVDQFLSLIGDARYDPRNKLTIGYTLNHKGKRTMTATFDEWQQIIKQPTTILSTTMTYDLVAQKQLSIADVLAPDADQKGTIGGLLYDYFKQHGVALSPQQYVNLLQFKTQSVQKFWVNSDTITFAFNPRQLDAKDDLDLVTIKKQLLGDVLRPEYATSDPGQDVSVKSDFIINDQPTVGQQIDPNGKLVALTFDDGPGPYTLRVLDILKRYRAHATFFVIGRQVTGHADVVNRTLADGNEIGNHSWDHASLPALSRSRLDQEVESTQQVIQSAANGYVPTQMRPPYGSVNNSIRSYLAERNLKTALWNADTLDWNTPDSSIVHDRIIGAAADARIILLHDIHPWSVDAVERAIPELVAAGYQLVTLSQLEQYR